MKTVMMISDYDYHVHPRRMIRFHAGITYVRVIEAAAQAIERAGAGRIMPPGAAGTYLTRDAGPAFRPKKRS